MQRLYPEGYVFIYALYALAWCEVVETLPLEGIKTAIMYEDWQLAAPLSSGINTLLLARSTKEDKCYLFGQLPIVDAFMAWSNVSICKYIHSESRSWRWKFQLASLFILAFLGIGIKKV